ncbi:MAG: GDSL-type esterase/lipase family protein [Eubacteriales bacterium]
MEKEQLDRINELGRAMKTRPLTDAEKAEQARLRAAYLREFRRKLRGESKEQGPSMVQTTLREAASHLKLLGRTAWQGEQLLLDWSAAGFDLCFRADRLTLDCLPYMGVQPVYVLAEIDGRAHRFALDRDRTSLTVEDLGQGAHRLRFIRLSEGGEPLLLTELRLYGPTTTLLPPPPPKERKIVILGDSITAGYGNLSHGQAGEYLTREQDVSVAYSYLTAQALDADYQIVAISGQGVVRNCHGEVGARLFEFFDHRSRSTREPYDHATFTPDAVVINAGTNDAVGKVSAADFEAGVSAFLDRVRSAYPRAHIFWLYGLMGNPYDSVLRALIERRRHTDSAIHYVPIASIGPDPEEIGVHWHPTRKAHVRAADLLTAAVKEALDW